MDRSVFSGTADKPSRSESMGSVTEVVRRQCECLFVNIEFIFDFVDDDLLAQPMCRWPLWRQLYHMLHSVDQWFINPFEFQEPHVNGAVIKALNTEVDTEPMSKGLLHEYYRDIESRVRSYLSTLSDSDLLERPSGSPLSRFDLILGQSRHVMYHVGMIHGCLVMATGTIPDYRGLGITDPPTQSASG
jgi:hypothetical protein